MFSVCVKILIHSSVIWGLRKLHFTFRKRISPWSARSADSLQQYQCFLSMEKVSKGTLKLWTSEPRAIQTLKPNLKIDTDATFMELFSLHFQNVLDTNTNNILILKWLSMSRTHIKIFYFKSSIYVLKLSKQRIRAP